MGNPFYNRFGNKGNPNNLPGPLGNMQNFMQRFQQFKSQFQGDPRQQVQNLLDSGQMTQEQFNQLSNMAKMYQNLFK